VGWHLHPDAILMALLLMGVYLAGAHLAGRTASPPARLTGSQTALYTSGVLLLYIGAGSPLHDISEKYLLSAHMVQHMLFTLMAPPLLLLGTPGWMLRPLIRNPHVRRAAFMLTRAFPAFLIFNFVILFTHLPPVVDLALRHHDFHFFVHVVLVASAVLMWWPIFSPLPELPRLSPFPQLIYLFVQSLLPAVIASFLTLGSTVIYQFYAEAPVRYWGLSASNDQVIAGLIMKLAGGTLIWLVMAVIFFRWFAAEDKRTALDTAVRWPEVEAELERMGLTKR
jgi:putative membrane protein